MKFLSVLSHEMQTPLNAVLGMLRLLVGTDSLASIHRDYVRIAYSNCHRLVLLVRDLLDRTRLEYSGLRLTSSPLDIMHLLDSLIDAISYLFYSRSLELYIGVAPSLCHVFVGDGDRISQVILNLLSNACKFSSGRSVALWIGPVDELKPPHVDSVTGAPLLTSHGSRAKPGSNLICFSVCDRGAGISPRESANLFLPFYRIDNAVSRNSGGTGLGLSICKSLVELMGGVIAVDSVLGVGSTFSFVIPLEQQHPQSPPDTGACLQTGTVYALLVTKSREQRSSLCANIAFVTQGHCNVQTFDRCDEGFFRAVTSAPANSFVLIDESFVHEAALTEDQLVELSLLDAPVRYLCCKYQAKPLSDRYQAVLGKDVSPPILYQPVKLRALNHFFRTGKRMSDDFFSPLNLDPYVESQDVLVSTVADRDRSPSRKRAVPNDGQEREHQERLSVLVVDDKPINIVVAKQFLQRCGEFEIATASSGRIAVELASQRRFDLILMDIIMPEMDGEDTAKQIRLQEEGKSTRTFIVALTAEPQLVTTTNVFDDTLTKPISLDMLSSLVHRFLSSEKRQRTS